MFQSLSRGSLTKFCLAAVLAISLGLCILPAAKGLAPVGDAADGNSITGILGALTDEVKFIEEKLTDKGQENVVGLTFITGKLGDRRVVLALGGVGKVNAAMTAAVMVCHFHPREILFTGISGGVSPDVRPGDIILAAKTAQHDFGVVTDKGFQPDMDKDPATGEPTPRFIPADGRLLALAQDVAGKLRLPKVHTSAGDRQVEIRTGVVVTGDVFVASKAKKDELRKVFQADAVEMEGAAVACVCRRLGTSCLVIRSVSDSADASAQADLARFIRAAAGNSAAVVIEMTRRLATTK